MERVPFGIRKKQPKIMADNTLLSMGKNKLTHTWYLMLRVFSPFFWRYFLFSQKNLCAICQLWPLTNNCVFFTRPSPYELFSWYEKNSHNYQKQHFSILYQSSPTDQQKLIFLGSPLKYKILSVKKVLMGIAIRRVTRGQNPRK